MSGSLEALANGQKEERRGPLAAQSDNVVRKHQDTSRQIPLLRVMIKETVKKPEDEDERDVHVCKKERIKGKMEPRRE